jgi:hypothetical protein
MVATVFLKKNLSIPPTLKIREGYGFNVVVVKDLVFAKPKRSTELLTSKERHKMRSIEIIPRDGSHYILVDGKEWSRHNDLKIAEQVRAELMRDERGINLEGNKEEQNLALRAAVETGVISMAPPERDETMYEVEMEMER